jgi:hypothetical protein
MHRLEKAALVFVFTPSSAVMLLPRYITKTQLGTFKDTTQTTTRQRTNRPHTISPARFRCYPPTLYTRPTSRALFPSQALPTPTLTLAPILLRRSRHRFHCSSPIDTQSFILYSIPLLIRPISLAYLSANPFIQTKPIY